MKYVVAFILAFANVAAHSQIPHYVPTDGLVGFWPFNGNPQDQFDNFLGGSAFGATLTTDRFGNPDSAYQFGINKYIEVPYSPLLKPTDKLSVSCFLQLDTFPGMWQDIVSNWRDQPAGVNKRAWNFTVTYNHKLEGVISYNGGTANQGVYFTPPFALGTWYHAVFTYDGSFLKLYLNNVLVQTASGAGNVFDESESLIRFGVKNNYNNLIEPFHGKIDDIGIWNRALTPCEVAQLYSGNAASIVSQSALSFCEGDSVTLLGNTGSNFTYQWYKDNAIILGATNSFYVATQSGNYELLLSDSVCSTRSVSVPVTDIDGAAGPNIFGDSSFCEGGESVLTSSSLNYNQWSTGDSTQSIVVSAPGSYSVYLTNGSCQSDTTAFTVVSTPMPDAAVIQHNDTLIAVSLSAAYQWVDCKDYFSPLVGATSQFLVPETAGSYALVVSENECRDTSWCATVLGTNVEHTSRLPNLEIFPNPVYREFILPAFASICTVTLFNNLGCEVPSKHLYNIVNVEQLRPGVYTVLVVCNELAYTYKIAKN